MSTIRSVLLQLDATPTSAARLEFARSVALRQEAALSAMFVVSPSAGPGAAGLIRRSWPTRHTRAFSAAIRRLTLWFHWPPLSTRKVKAQLSDAVDERVHLALDSDLTALGVAEIEQRLLELRLSKV